jgi:hypothetical protein
MSYSKFRITKLTSLQKLNILTKVNEDNAKLITAQMTNDFFNSTWCIDKEREKLLAKKVLVDREYFSNTNGTG